MFFTIIGNNLASLYPSFIRLTKDEHWQININGEWITVAGHQYLGRGLILFDPTPTGKLFGLFLLIDDYADFENDVIQGNTPRDTHPYEMFINIKNALFK